MQVENHSMVHVSKFSYKTHLIETVLSKLLSVGYCSVCLFNILSSTKSFQLRFKGFFSDTSGNELDHTSLVFLFCFVWVWFGLAFFAVSELNILYFYSVSAFSFSSILNIIHTDFLHWMACSLLSLLFVLPGLSGALGCFLQAGQGWPSIHPALNLKQS